METAKLDAYIKGSDDPITLTVSYTTSEEKEWDGFDQYLRRTTIVDIQSIELPEKFDNRDVEFSDLGTDLTYGFEEFLNRPRVRVNL